ncbi:MAG: tetratricopeptide repeat protein [Bryobacterales bacterium]|nr:tetratricopeptide repeat protein [Bryobacterales bacterium]
MPILLLFAAATAAALSEQAVSAAQQGQPAEAEKLWRAAITADANYFPALFNFGVFLHRAQRQAEAAPLLDRAAAVQPGFQVHFVRGLNYQQLERRDETIRAWRAALGLQPENAKLLQILCVEYTRGRYFQEAAALARDGLKRFPSQEPLYFLALKALQDAGDMETAASVAAEAVRRFPHSARAQFEHGYFLQKRGDMQTAMQHLSKAMELDANYEEPFFFYGDLLVRQSQWEPALAPLRQALKIRPEYSPARVALARALMNLNQVPEAIVELEQAAQLDPKNAQPWVMLSQLYFRLGDETKAKTAKDMSVKLRRENPTVLEAVQGRPFPAR